MSEPSPVLPLPAIKSPRPHSQHHHHHPFSFHGSASEPYLPPDPSRFAHFMPSPISSTSGRNLDLPSPSLLSAGVQLGGQANHSGSVSPSGYAALPPSSAGSSNKRSYAEHDATASPETGGSLDESVTAGDGSRQPVKEEADELTASTAGTGENGAQGRVLKNSKRAAQNRAAQQAFRKRKEERIRELEEKERQLQAYESRANELRRREQELVEREQLFTLRQIKAESMGTNGTTASTSSSLFPYGAQPPQQQQQPSYTQPSPQASAQKLEAERAAQAERDARLDDAHKMLLDAQADYNDLKRQLDERDGLIAALRRSLEDMGSENRQLRAAAGIQSPGLSTVSGPTSDVRRSSRGET